MPEVAWDTAQAAVVHRLWLVALTPTTDPQAAVVRQKRNSIAAAASAASIPAASGLYALITPQQALPSRRTSGPPLTPEQAGGHARTHADRAMSSSMRVLIVGGVAGGASCAARLRRLTEAAKITIFERQANVSYANCGLPYRIGDVITVRRGAVYACAARCCCPRRDAAPLPLACAPLVQGASAAAVLSPLICTGRCPRPLTSGASSCHPV